MMTDVILKDKSGNDVAYTNVKSIDIPAPDGASASFLNTDTGTCYYATMEEVGGVYHYTIKGQWFAGHTSRSIYGAVDSGMCQEFGQLLDGGSYQLIVIFTSKSLTSGQTYTEDEL